MPMMIFLISFYNFAEALDIFNDVFLDATLEMRHWTCAVMANFFILNMSRGIGHVQ